MFLMFITFKNKNDMHLNNVKIKQMSIGDKILFWEKRLMMS